MIWTVLFAILLGCTVDILEMTAEVAPTNFPYTAISFFTGSCTSILAGYIGMRIAVYTNTRVTYMCTASVHRGFVVAFRGGQVLGFCLVGLGVLNIMIIIMIFKVGWYDEYLTYAVEAGRPVNRCPNVLADKEGFTWANAQLQNSLTDWLNNTMMVYYRKTVVVDTRTTYEYPEVTVGAALKEYNAENPHHTYANVIDFY